MTSDWKFPSKEQGFFFFLCGFCWVFLGFFFLHEAGAPLILHGEFKFNFRNINLTLIYTDSILKTLSLLLRHQVLSSQDISQPNFPHRWLVIDLAGCTCHFLPQPPITLLPWGQRVNVSLLQPQKTPGNSQGRLLQSSIPHTLRTSWLTPAEHTVGKERLWVCLKPPPGWMKQLNFGGGKTAIVTCFEQVWSLYDWFSYWRLCHRRCTEKE